MQNHYLQESTSLLTSGYIKIELATSVILQDSVIWIKCEKLFPETSHKWRAFIIVHALPHGPRLRSITHNVCLTNTKELISPKSSYHRHGINKQSPSSIVQWMYSTSRNEGNFVKFTLRKYHRYNWNNSHRYNSHRYNWKANKHLTLLKASLVYVFFTFFKLYKWCQIAKSVPNISYSKVLWLTRPSSSQIPIKYFNRSKNFGSSPFVLLFNVSK